MKRPTSFEILPSFLLLHMNMTHIVMNVFFSFKSHTRTMFLPSNRTFETTAYFSPQTLAFHRRGGEFSEKSKLVARRIVSLQIALIHTSSTPDINLYSPFYSFDSFSNNKHQTICIREKVTKVINMKDDLMIRPAARARITKCSHLYSTFGRLEAKTCEALQQAQTLYRQQQQEVEMDSTADSVLFSSDDMDWTSSADDSVSSTSSEMDWSGEMDWTSSADDSVSSTSSEMDWPSEMDWTSEIDWTSKMDWTSSSDDSVSSMISEMDRSSEMDWTSSTADSVSFWSSMNRQSIQ